MSSLSHPAAPGLSLCSEAKGWGLEDEVVQAALSDRG